MTDDDVKDQTGSVPTDLVPSIEAARKHGLPAVVFLDAGGKVIAIESLPEDTAAMIEILEKRE